MNDNYIFMYLYNLFFKKSFEMKYNKYIETVLIQFRSITKLL